MTLPEQEAQRSRVKISTTAKGDALVEVSVRANEPADEMARIRGLAVETYQQTLSDLGIRAQERTAA